MRYIVYGDVHGCLEEWEELRKLLPVETSVEICVGDILDKGPYPVEALRYARKNRIISVMGNHEFKHLRKWLGRNVILDENQQEVYPQLTADDFYYIASFPFFLKLNHLTILHAGITNSIHLGNAPLTTLKNLLYIRDLDQFGNPLHLHHSHPNPQFWSEIYRGGEGFVIYGHSPFLEVRQEYFSLGIDTGVVYGNKLTAVIIEDTLKPWEFEIVQVKAKEKYAEPIRELPFPTTHSFTTF